MQQFGRWSLSIIVMMAVATLATTAYAEYTCEDIPLLERLLQDLKEECANSRQ